MLKYFRTVANFRSVLHLLAKHTAGLEASQHLEKANLWQAQVDGSHPRTEVFLTQLPVFRAQYLSDPLEMLLPGGS